MQDDTAYLAIARQIICKELDINQYAIFLFGSRTQKAHSKTSDIDIGVLGHQPLPLSIKAHLLELLNDSDIPYKVDVVDFFNADKKFRNFALKNIIIWNRPNSISLD